MTNAAIVFSAQAVEHYEITRYGSLIAWATELGRDDLVRPLKANLREEKAADRKLTSSCRRSTRSSICIRRTSPWREDICPCRSWRYFWGRRQSALAWWDWQWSCGPSIYLARLRLRGRPRSCSLDDHRPGLSGHGHHSGDQSPCRGYLGCYEVNDECVQPTSGPHLPC